MSMKSKELQSLLHLESSVIQSVQFAQSTLQEMSKDTMVDTQKIKSDTQNMMKSIQHINERLLHTISYLGDVSTSALHGGSVYNVEKDFQLSHEQTRLMLDRLNKLSEKSKLRGCNANIEKKGT